MNRVKPISIHLVVVGITIVIGVFGLGFLSGLWHGSNGRQAVLLPGDVTRYTVLGVQTGPIEQDDGTYVAPEHRLRGHYGLLCGRPLYTVAGGVVKTVECRTNPDRKEFRDELSTLFANIRDTYGEPDETKRVFDPTLQNTRCRTGGCWATLEVWHRPSAGVARLSISEFTPPMFRKPLSSELARDLVMEKFWQIRRGERAERTAPAEATSAEVRALLTDVRQRANHQTKRCGWRPSQCPARLQTRSLACRPVWSCFDAPSYADGAVPGPIRGGATDGMDFGRAQVAEGRRRNAVYRTAVWTLDVSSNNAPVASASEIAS